MTDLSIQNNKVLSLSGIHRLESLTFLNASSNNLSDRLSDLAVVSSLSVLDLRDNNISTYTQLEPLKRLHNLKRLYLRSSPNSSCNTVCEKEDYKQRVLEYLPHLVSLDGEMIAFMKTNQDTVLDNICRKDKLVSTLESKIEPWFSSDDLRLPNSTQDEKIVLETETKILEELRLSEGILKRHALKRDETSMNRNKKTTTRLSKKNIAAAAVTGKQKKKANSRRK